MPTKRPPRDVNELARYVLDVTTGDAEKIEPPAKNQSAVESGRRGGHKGGKVRAARLSSKKRSEIAKRAAKARWKTR